MKTRKRPSMPIVLGALLFLATSMAPVRAQDADAYGDDYRGGDYGRVRYQENGAAITRAELDPAQAGLEQADVNAPIFPGDTILTSHDQRVEVQLADGAIVRVDRRSEMTFQALPDPYREIADNTVLQVAEGTIRLTAAIDDEEEFRIDTPAATVYLLGNADIRIEVTENQRIRVQSRRGVVEVVGAGGSAILRGGNQIEVSPGSIPNKPGHFNTFGGDGFDRWVEQRESTYRTRDHYAGTTEAYEELPDEVRPYYRELSSSGNWVYVEDYGQVWYPRNVGQDWRPYQDGYWDYGPGGYFWVSAEPWGWAPYHYGRWNWMSGYGWCWSPGRVFAGAWVSWSWGSAYVGWAPLDYWGYPAYRHTVHHGYYDPYSWSFVSYHHIGHRNYHDYYVGWDHAGDDVLRHGAVVTRPPKVSPDRLASSAETRRQAVAEARNDPRRRISPAGDTRVGRSMTDVENRLSRQATRSGTGRQAAASTDRGTRSRSTRVTSPARRSPTATGNVRRDPGTRAGRQGGIVRTSPRATTQPSRSRDRAATRPSRSRERATTPSRTTTPRSRREVTALPEVKPRQNVRQGTTQRLRDLYRRVAKPRQTREKPRATTPRRGTTASPGTRPSRPSPPAARPSKGRSSQPGASRGSSSRSSKPSRPTAKPRSGSTSKPKASPSRGSRGSAKSTRGSRGR